MPRSELTQVEMIERKLRVWGPIGHLQCCKQLLLGSLPGRRCLRTSHTPIGRISKPARLSYLQNIGLDADEGYAAAAVDTTAHVRFERSFNSDLDLGAGLIDAAKALAASDGLRS